MKNKNSILILSFCLSLMILFPDLAHAGLEGSLEGIKYKLTGVILPLLAVIGIALSALSLFTGNLNAKQHVGYAILGCIFGFGAQAIVDFIAQTVR